MEKQTKDWIDVRAAELKRTLGRCIQCEDDQDPPPVVNVDRRTKMGRAVVLCDEILNFIE
jgi:hypothetical protein